MFEVSNSIPTGRGTATAVKSVLCLFIQQAGCLFYGIRQAGCPFYGIRQAGPHYGDDTCPLKSDIQTRPEFAAP